MSVPLESDIASLRVDQTALLMEAIDHKSVDEVKKQLALGASVDAQCISPDWPYTYTSPSCDGPYGWRPLQRAVFKHRPEVVACLLQHGANVNSCSFKKKRYGALRLAARAQKDILRDMEDEGIPRKRSPGNSTYSEHCYRRMRRNFKEIITILLEHGADDPIGLSLVAKHPIARKRLAKARWGKVRWAVRVRPFGLHWIEAHAKAKYKEPDTTNWQALTRLLCA